MLRCHVSRSQALAALQPLSREESGVETSRAIPLYRVGIEWNRAEGSCCTTPAYAVYLRTLFFRSLSGFPDLLARPLTAQMNAIQVELSS